MGAVRTERKVVLIQQVSLTDTSCFLTGGQVGRAGIGVVDAVVRTLGLNEVQHGLELTQDGHITEDTNQVFLGELAGGQLLSNGLVVLVNRDILEGNFAGLSNLGRIHKQTLRHSLLLLSYLASSAVKFSRFSPSSFWNLAAGVPSTAR